MSTTISELEQTLLIFSPYLRDNDVLSLPLSGKEDVSEAIPGSITILQSFVVSAVQLDLTPKESNATYLIFILCQYI